MAQSLTSRKLVLNILIAAACVAAATYNRTDYLKLSRTTALINGKIYTVNLKQPWAEAVVIKNEKIVFVGTNEESKAHIGLLTKVIDLEGRFVLPGFHDTHVHPIDVGSERVTCLLEETQTLDEMIARIKNCDPNDKKHSWLVGAGHNVETLLASKKAPRLLLDEINRERPIVIMDSTSHSVWVNSKALELAKISKDSPPFQGGVVLKDSSGVPTGILLDSTADHLFDLAYESTPELDNDNYEAVLFGLEQLAKNGITSAVDARVYWKRRGIEAWKRVEREKMLTARIVLSVWAYPLDDDDKQLAKLKSLYQRDPDRRLRVSQIKLYSDGITLNTTAALLAPYTETLPGVPPLGINYFDQKRMTRYVSELQYEGFDIHIHAIGDRGVRESLNAIEAARNNGSFRHRITHLEMVAPEDVSRFSKLGVIADFQLAGEFSRPEKFHESESVIGKRAYRMLPVRDLYDTGAKLTLSSDWDVGPLSPFVGIQNALTRGKQSLPDLDSAIRAYTINGAYTMRQEKMTGSIELGKFGDLIVLDQDLFEIPVDEIRKTQVDLTVLGGEIVYDSGN